METAGGGLSRLREPLYFLQDQTPAGLSDGDPCCIALAGYVGPAAECARQKIYPDGIRFCRRVPSRFWIFLVFF